MRSPSSGAPTLGAFQYGSHDPTTRIGANSFARATWTPEGPGTLVIRWTGEQQTSEGFGPGGDWLVRHAAAMCGADDPGHQFESGHPVVLAAQRDHDVRFGASRTLYHELLPTVLGQRITAGEALRQWRDLTRELGPAAPGPIEGLRLPPDPELLAGKPTWWFHPLGVEAKRAATLRELGRRFEKLQQWSQLGAGEAAQKLAVLPGIGEWTIGSVRATAFGDPDAVAVGDFHLKNLVVHAFTGRPRGTDDEMLDLLAPYAPHRGRVIRLLQLAGHAPPKFGPRREVLPMRRW
ncbi:MAG TPA: hypothetical protein PLV13_09160 [Ilumatobacteraceae bacterium]|nr:hypothetical protein [Ilumatobacteraceae bacterium]